MALTIVKPDKRGRQQVVAGEDMYLDESGTKVIIVKEGETVPPEASSVLAMRGGKVHARFAKMVEEAGAKVIPQPNKAKSQSKPAPEPTVPKPETVEEKPE